MTQFRIASDAVERMPPELSCRAAWRHICIVIGSDAEISLFWQKAAMNLYKSAIFSSTGRFLEAFHLRDACNPQTRIFKLSCLLMKRVMFNFQANQLRMSPVY